MSKALTSFLLILALAGCGKSKHRSEHASETKAPESTTQAGQPIPNKALERPILGMAAPGSVAPGSVDATGIPTAGCRHGMFSYDMRVTGFRRVVDTAKDIGGSTLGTVTTTADWTGEWANVGVGVEQCALSVQIRMPPVQGPDLHPATGEIHLKYDYADAVPASSPDPRLDPEGGAPPCHYQKDVRFAADMYADADAYWGARGVMHFDFQAKPHAGPDLSGACPAGPRGYSRSIAGVRSGEWSVDDGLRSVRGWDWGISNGILTINNQRAPVTPLPFPFDALLAGKGFILDSELQRAIVSGNHDPHSAQVTDRLIISFSPAVKH